MSLDMHMIEEPVAYMQIEEPWGPLSEYAYDNEERESHAND